MLAQMSRFSAAFAVSPQLVIVAHIEGGSGASSARAAIGGGVITERDGRVPFGLAVSAIVDEPAGAGGRMRSAAPNAPGGGSSITRSWLAGASGKRPAVSLRFLAIAGCCAVPRRG